MLKFFKLATFTLVSVGIIAIVINLNSERLTTHRVSLECEGWDESSPNARQYLQWPQDEVRYFQMRNDWVNGQILGYLVAAKKNGLVSFLVFEENDRYFHANGGGDGFKSIIEYNRETLKNKMIIEYDNGETLWVGGDCKVISTASFEAAREKEVVALMEKQKI